MIIPATRGEHAHVRRQGQHKDLPVGYRIVGYQVDQDGIIDQILVRDVDGSIIPLSEIENDAWKGNRRVEIVTYDWIGCCEATWR